VVAKASLCDVGWLQLRGKLIGALDKCSGNLQNMDQIVKTSDVMTSVTSSPDEVKDTDKVSISIVRVKSVQITL